MAACAVDRQGGVGDLRFNYLFLLVYLLASAAGGADLRAAPTEGRQTQLKQREQHFRNFSKQYQSGHPKEALSELEKALALERELFGTKSEEVARCLALCAYVREEVGDWAAAQKAAAEVIQICTQLHGDNHWRTLDARLDLRDLQRRAEMKDADRQRWRQFLGLRQQAEGLRQQGRAREALPFAEKALASQAPLSQAFPRAHAEALNGLALAHHDLGDYARALPFYEQARDLRKQVLGEKHPAYAESLNNLALLFQDQGKFKDALPLFQQARSLHRELFGERHERYANSLNNLALLFDDMGDYGEALAMCQQALAVRKQLFGEENPSYAQSLNSLATCYFNMGEYPKALPLYQQTHDIYRKQLGDNHPLCATSLNNLASVYEEMGEFAKALPLFQKSAELREKILGENHPLYAVSLNNQALLYLSLEQYDDALALFQKVRRLYLKNFGEQHILYASGLHHLALTYQRKGEYAKALPLFEQARDIRKKLGEEHPDYARSLDSLALLHQEMGRADKALPLARQACDLRRRVLGEHHPHTAQSLHQLALLHFTQGEYVQAKALFLQALASLRQSPAEAPLALDRLSAAEFRPLPLTALVLHNLGRTLHRRADEDPSVAGLRASDDSFRLAIALLERLRSEVLDQEDSKVKLAADRSDLFAQRLGVLSKLFALEPQSRTMETAFLTAEFGTARSFVESLGKARGRGIGGVPAALRQEEEQRLQALRLLDGRIDKEVARSPERRDPELISKLYLQRQQADAELQKLLKQMEREYPQYAALKYPRPCSPEQARACLEENEVALLFVTGHETSCVVVVQARPKESDRSGGVAIYPLPGVEDLADLVSSLTDLNNLASTARIRALGTEAAQALLAPLLETIKGKALVIVPSGPLCHMPFELLVGEDGKYLVESHRIRYAASLTALHLTRLWEKTRARPDRLLWAAGDPVYGVDDERLSNKGGLAVASREALVEYQSRAGQVGGRLEFGRLKHSGREVKLIGELLKAPADNVRTGLGASEAAIKAASAQGELARYRYLHFATHGILGLDKGRQPALVLSLVKNEQEDGFLQMDEVTNLKLNADLVVLGACQSGKGRLSNGEGVRGLARAFLYAGSRGVVCSLWSVEDRATAELMASLYRRLQEGQSAAEALRQAQLQMIRAGRPPLYWAPFILIGE